VSADIFNEGLSGMTARPDIFRYLVSAHTSSLPINSLSFGTALHFTPTTFLKEEIEPVTISEREGVMRLYSSAVSMEMLLNGERRHAEEMLSK
jgi:hypothetical protein